MDAISFHSNISKKFNDHYYNSSLFSERFRVWTYLINKYLNKDNLVLDAGCGSGIFSFYIAQKGNKVLAVDGSDEMIKLCKKKLSEYKDLDIRFKVEKLPFNKLLPVEQFDFIISSSVLEYISDYESCLNDFKIQLKTNGILIVSLPNKESIYRKLEKIIFRIFKKPDYLRFVKTVSTIQELNAIMSSKGFETLENRLYSSGTYLNKIARYIFIPKRYTSSLFVGVYKKI